MSGEIVNCVLDRGFFFIKGEDGKQYFAHKSSLCTPRWIHDIREGDTVTFTPTDAEKGPRAEGVNVTRLAAA